jgi:hypothetical protein
VDPQSLIDQTSSISLPAPLWFIQFFKVLGFTLHMVPMNLWYAGLLLALLLRLGGHDQARRFGARLMTQMPVIIAFGVNFGIVPLLFAQLAYYRVFYPATILMAWFWLAIIGLLIPAYYGVYIYVWGLREGGAGLTTAKRVAGWCAAVFFIVIGFLFTNGLSLMSHVERWPALWSDHNVAGAATGTALNVGDPTFWPRWLLMPGLALTTTAVWLLFDSAWFARKETDDYRRWAADFAPKLYTLGMVWFAAAGTWYVFGTWSDSLRKAMFEGPTIVLTVATAVGPGLPWLLILLGRRHLANRAIVSLIAVAQFGVLGLNAISRQVVQDLNLKPYLDLSGQPLAIQWSPLLGFLILFVAGLGVIVWMIVQVTKAAERPT